MRKTFTAIVILIVLLGLVVGYVFTGIAPRRATQEQVEQPAPPKSNFVGPTGEPHVSGPTSPPSQTGPANAPPPPTIR